MCFRLPKLVCSTEGVKCVIVDSIAAVFRCETRSDISHVERSEIFFQLASRQPHSLFPSILPRLGSQLRLKIKSVESYII